jgi:acyl phosphate:glycerol-3-phosphate acyltransferase
MDFYTSPVPVLPYIIVALGAYLLGSIPFGFLVAKAKGIDIRKVGSGNIGATNAMRVLGKPAGIFVLLMDALKGYAAVAWVAPFVFFQFSPDRFWEHPSFVDIQLQSVLGARFMVLAGVCAVLGHNYTCWLKFKGGKGIATTAGVYIALAPLPMLIAAVVFFLAVALTKYISVGSISAAIVLPAAVWIMTPHNVLLGVVTTALGTLAIYKHKSNLQRLIAGTENRLGKKVEATK